MPVQLPPGVLEQASRKSGVPVNVLLAVIGRESGGDAHARSKAGAMGLMQLMPGTARSLGVRDPYNAVQSLMGGSAYLGQQLKKFKRLDLALSAYNSGPGGSESQGRVEGYPETQKYVSSILAKIGQDAGNARPQPQSLSRENGNSALDAPTFDRRALADALLGSRGHDGKLDTWKLLEGIRTLRSSTPSPTPTPAAPMAAVGRTGVVPHTPAGGLNTDFEHRLNLLKKAVEGRGGTLDFNSGFRSVERQAQLWQAALIKYGSVAEARKWVAPPGHSKHGEGLAMDLGGDLNLAHELAPQFGLTFPLGNEAWHIEPVGARG